jgi:hypothetical protein
MCAVCRESMTPRCCPDSDQDSLRCCCSCRHPGAVQCCPASDQGAGIPSSHYSMCRSVCFHTSHLTPHTSSCVFSAFSHPTQESPVTQCLILLCATVCVFTPHTSHLTPHHVCFQLFTPHTGGSRHAVPDHWIVCAISLSVLRGGAKGLRIVCGRAVASCHGLVSMVIAA